MSTALEYLITGVAYALTFLLFIVIPAPVWVALIVLGPLVFMVVVVATR